jgi:hypothetical protein
LHASTLPCLAVSWRGVRSLVKRNIRTAFQTGVRRETFGGKTCHSSHRPTSALCCKSRRNTSTCPFRMELRRGVVILSNRTAYQLRIPEKNARQGEEGRCLPPIVGCVYVSFVKQQQPAHVQQLLPVDASFVDGAEQRAGSSDKPGNRRRVSEPRAGLGTGRGGEGGGGEQRRRGE